MPWVISEESVDFMKKPDSRLASFDGVGPDAVVSAVFQPVSDGFRGDGEVVGQMVVVQPLAEQGQVRLVFPDGDGLDAAEKLAELEVGCPCGYMAVEVVVHGFWGNR